MSVSGPASSRARSDGSTVVERDDPALCLGDRLLRDDDDVPGLERRGARDERAEIVSLLDLGEALDREDLDHAGGIPVTAIPAWAR